MKARSQRLLSILLATVYAVLAMFGGALHQCVESNHVASHAASCGHSFCQLQAELGSKSAFRSDSTGSDGESVVRARHAEPSGQEESTCAACLTLAQLKVGKASLPTRLPEAPGVFLSWVVSDPEALSASPLAYFSRGPPTSA